MTDLFRKNNQKIIRYFSEAYQRDRLSHAYILEGAEEAGVRELADYAASGILCDRMQQMRQTKDFILSPCGTCPSCIKASTGNHPDIIHVTHEKETVLSVGEIREQVVGDVAIKPYYGPYKIYIIPQSELMNENAQNALLKTIEEPQDYALILLLTDNADRFLPTVRSRCIRMRMDDLPRTETVQRLLDEDGQRAIEFLRTVSSLTAVDITKAAKELEPMDRQKILKLYRFWVRDLMVFKSTGDKSRLYCQMFAEDIQRIAGNVSYEALNHMLTSFETLSDRLKANVKADAAYEIFLLQIQDLR